MYMYICIYVYYVLYVHMCVYIAFIACLPHPLFALSGVYSRGFALNTQRQ